MTGIPDDLAAVVRPIYSGGAVKGADGVYDALRARSRATGDVAAQSATGEWKGTPVAVVTAGKDVTLAVKDTHGWQVVGGWWPSLGVPDGYLGGVRHVLLLGSDARPHENVDHTRADSIHIVGFDAAHGGGILGIPRDSYVPLSTGGKNKINAALATGGPTAMVATVQAFTGIPLEGYVLTGFDGYKAIVDSVGGLSIDVLKGLPKLGIAQGRQVLDGVRALKYARDRHGQPDGDFGRSRNQGRILIAGAVMARTAGPLALPRYLTLAGPHLHSDLDAASILTLAARAYYTDPAKFGNEVAVGGFGTGPGGSSIVVPGDEARRLFADLRDGNLS